MREPIWPPSLFKMDHFQITGRCPLWVKSRHSHRTKACPLYLQKQTFSAASEMSDLCQ